ncbi:MAG: hypothetical protein NT154_27000 [Verrucomicrobia bacterium]|nr:hypothetical protein [Verrucomicrobiota bacterium]
MATDESSGTAVTPKKLFRSSAIRWGIALLLLLVSVFLIWRVSIWVITWRQLAQIHNAGYPVSLGELNSWYKEVPDNENAALAYEKAFGLLKLDAKAKALLKREQTNSLAQPAALSAAGKAEIDALLATNVAALKVLQKGLQGNKCRYSIDLVKGYNAPLSHLSGVKDGDQLLLLKAVIEHGEGRTDEAVQALMGALDLSRSLVGEPSTTSEVVRISSMERTLRVLELLLSQHRFSDNQLAALAGRMHPEEFPQALERALAGERCNGLWAFGSSASEWVSQV